MIKRVQTIDKKTLFEIMTYLADNCRECIFEEYRSFYINFANFNRKTLNIVNRYKYSFLFLSMIEENNKRRNENMNTNKVNQKNNPDIKNNENKTNASLLKKKRTRFISTRVRK